MPGTSIQLAAKRTVDLLGSAMGILLLSPLLALCAIAIRLDSPGPALFFQERLGLRGREFQVYKFRTMVVGAPDGAVVAQARDPRVTSVGAFLRRWSLDELPQLFNVLRGEMSLVGPRPDRVFRLATYTEEQRRRLSMKPGMTGLAQISGRNAIPWEKRYQLDLVYIDSWSLGLDVRILFKTSGVVLGRQGVNYAQATPSPPNESNQ